MNLSKGRNTSEVPYVDDLECLFEDHSITNFPTYVPARSSYPIIEGFRQPFHKDNIKDAMIENRNRIITGRLGGFETCDLKKHPYAMGRRYVIQNEFKQPERKVCPGFYANPDQLWNVYN